MSGSAMDRVPWRKHMNSALNCPHVSQHHEVLVACPACVSLALANHDADLRVRLEQVTEANTNAQMLIDSMFRDAKTSAATFTLMDLQEIYALLNSGSQNAMKNANLQNPDSVGPK